MSRYSSIACCAVLLYNLNAVDAWAAQPALDGGLSIEALLNAPILGHTSLSPDGRHFVYTVCDAERQQGLRKPPHERYTESGVPWEAVGCTLWIAATRAGTPPRQLTGAENSWAPVWSPDGRRLAFYSDRDGRARLWAWNLTDAQFSRVSEEIVHSGNVAVWTLDSARLIVPLVPESLGFEAVTTSRGKTQDLSRVWRYQGATVRVFHANAPGSTQARTGVTLQQREGRDVQDDFDLAYVELATGRAKRVAYVLGSHYSDYVVSPDRRQIALNVEVGQTKNSWNIVQQVELVAQDGTRKTVLPDTVNVRDLAWSPDGRYLAAVAKPFEAALPRFQVHFIRIADGAHTQSEVQTRVIAGSYGWDEQGENLYFPATIQSADLALERTVVERVHAADGAIQLYPIEGYRPRGIVRRQGSGAVWRRGESTLIFVGINQRTKDAALLGFNGASGEMTVLREAPEALKSLISGGQLSDVSADGKVFVAPKEASDQPVDYYVFEGSLKSARRLTDLNPQLSNQTFGKIQAVHWQGPEGKTLGGALLLPSNYVPGRRYPTIFETYPQSSGMGDRADALNFFGASGFGGMDNFEFLATRGYAVLRTQSVVLPDGKVAQGIADSLVSAAQKLIELGVADPEALGITGQSFGGYATLATITRSAMFKAAVVRAGPANLPGMAGALENDASGGSVIGAGILQSGFKLEETLWQNPQRYVQNSPIFALHKVNSAVLILHGTDDDRVPVTQGREVYAGLNLLGLEVELRQYDGERHGSSAFANKADQVYSMIRWFDAHLKKTNEPRGGASTACIVSRNPH